MTDPGDSEVLRGRRTSRMAEPLEPTSNEEQVINAFEHLCVSTLADIAAQEPFPPEDLSDIAMNIGRAIAVELGNRDHHLMKVLHVCLESWSRTYMQKMAEEVADGI